MDECCTIARSLHVSDISLKREDNACLYAVVIWRDSNRSEPA